MFLDWSVYAWEEVLIVFWYYYVLPDVIMPVFIAMETKAKAPEKAVSVGRHFDSLNALSAAFDSLCPLFGHSRFFYVLVYIGIVDNLGGVTYLFEDTDFLLEDYSLDFIFLELNISKIKVKNYLLLLTR